jgi:hopanoid biosynthesis associated RND transporter like protein HpnN
MMALADLAWRFPVLILALGTLLALGSAFYTWNHLEFDADRANLIRRTPELQANQDRYVAQFPKAEDMVVVVEGGTPEDRMAFVDDLAARLRAEPQTFRDVFEKVELSFLRTHALHYLDLATLEKLSGELARSRPLLDSLSSSKDMTGLLDSFGEVGSGEDPAGALAEILPFLNEAMGQLLVSLETRGRYAYNSPWAAAFFGEVAQEDQAPQELEAAGQTVFYNTVAKGRIHLLLARPAHQAGGGGHEATPFAVQRLRELLPGVQRSHPEVQVGLTGEPVLDTDEGNSSTEDSTRSSVLSLVFVALIFALAFRELYRPLMAVFTLVLGVTWTMGFTTLAVGHLNLLTVTFTTILIGLGIDFGIHFIYRYDEELVKGWSPLEAMKITLSGTGVENLTGAGSTAVAFWVLNLTDFIGIAELGTIAGTGIMLCYLAMVTVLPALLFLQHRWFGGGVGTGISQYRTLARMERAWLRHPWIVALLCVLFSVFCVLEARHVRYDYNLLNLQARGLGSVQTEMHLIHASEHSLLYGISLVADLSEARRLTEAFRKLPTVASVESIVPMIPDGYPAKRPFLEAITREMAQVSQPARASVQPGGASGNLLAMAGSFMELDHTFREAWPTLKGSEDQSVRREAARFKTALDRLFSTLEGMGPGPIEDGLTAFQKDFFADLQGLVAFLKDQVDHPPLTLEDVPDVLKVREVGRTGLIQLRVFPRQNVWERGPQERFVHSLQQVDPQVVGMPVVMYYDTHELRRANEQAGWYALVAIWILLLVHFRSLKIALLAIFPKAVGVLWMVGIMGYAGVDFNSANFLALPLILGIGLVFGVHVVHRVQEEGGDGVFNHSTGPAIGLAALTTMIGFGTMISAHHQGIATLGFVMTAGVGANLLASILFLPAVLRILRNLGVTL